MAENPQTPTDQANAAKVAERQKAERLAKREQAIDLAIKEKRAKTPAHAEFLARAGVDKVKLPPL